jgi:recombination protein RecR
MENDNYSSRLFEDAVGEFSKLPGIGKRTATRLVLHLLKQERANIEHFGQTLITLAQQIKHCVICHNISDNETCSICADKSRDNSTICVVENIKDVIAIENTRQYKGLYHVLGGILSPMEGFGPSDLNIASLELRLQNERPFELILALSPTMEGDTTNFYLYRKFSKYQIKLSTLARGVSFGDELEYADEITLGRSIINRQLFDGKNM